LITIIISEIKKPNNAFINTLEAFPLFMIGFYSRRFTGFASKDISICWLVGTLFLSALIVGLCGYFNGYVQMFQNLYGRYFLLFLLGGIVGTIGIWALCRMLGNTNRLVLYISKGTIIIMGFHPAIIPIFHKVLGKSIITDYTGALVLVILFVPIIYFSERYFPYLIGKMRS